MRWFVVEEKVYIGNTSPFSITLSMSLTDNWVHSVFFGVTNTHENYTAKVRWYSIDNTVLPSLTIGSESWALLSNYRELFMFDSPIDVSDFIERLRENGFNEKK